MSTLFSSFSESLLIINIMTGNWSDPVRYARSACATDNRHCAVFVVVLLFFNIIIIRMRYITFNRLIDNQNKKELGGHGFTKNLCYSLSALSLISALLFWRIWPRTDCISSSAASHDNIYCMTNSDHNKNVSRFYYLAACTHTFSTIFKCIHSPSLPLSLPLSSLPLSSLSLTFSSITLERGRRE